MNSSSSFDQQEDEKILFGSKKKAKLWTPKEIRAHLDDFVIGQDSLKRILSVAIYNHYKRLQHNLEVDFLEESLFGRPMNHLGKKGKASAQSEGHKIHIEKSNVLLIGPTGSGKTLIAKTTAKLLDVPFSMNDATPFTQAGNSLFIL